MAIPHKENFCKKFMAVGALCGRGVLPLIKIPLKVKVTTKYYIDFIFKPPWELEIPQLDGKDTRTVIVHHDAASPYTARLGEQYAKDKKDRLEITIF